MKKIIFTTSITLFCLLPILVSAITAGDIPTPTQLIPNAPVPAYRPDQLIDIVTGILRWIYTIFFIAAVAFILFAAFNYLTGAGNPEKIKSVHSQLLYAAIAIALALLSVGIIEIIKAFLRTPTT